MKAIENPGCNEVGELHFRRSYGETSIESTRATNSICGVQSSELELSIGDSVLDNSMVLD